MGSIVYSLNLHASLFQMAREKRGGKIVGHSCAPHCCNLIGRELPGAEFKLVEQHEAVQSTAIFRTNSKVDGNMASFFGKHLIYPSSGVPKSMADLRRYEGFFPNMSGATYDPISLMNEEKNLSREPSGPSSFSSDSTTPSHDDDVFSNATFAFSRYFLYVHDMEITCLGPTNSFWFNQAVFLCISCLKYKLATCLFKF